MKRFLSCHSFFLLFALLMSMVLGTSGCIATKEKSPPAPVIQPNEGLKEELEEVRKELESQKQLTAQLQMSLLEKHADVNRLTVMNENLVRDFVRNKATLRNRGDKVETVRLLAELATLVNTVKEGKPTGNQKALLLRAEQYQAESKVELDKGNFDGASYLADQALKQVQRIQLEKSSGGRQGGDFMVSFLAPLPMKFLVTSNVRKGPSKQEKVQFVLGAGEKATAVGYKGEWVKIKTKGQGSGWVHYSLLSGARE